MISDWNFFVSISIAILCIFLLMVVTPFVRRVHTLRSLPGPPVSHLFDTHAKYFRPMSDFFPTYRENSVKYPKLCRYVLAPWIIFVIVSHPEVLKQVYSELKADKLFSKKSFWRKRDAIFFADGAEWEDKRNMFRQAFHTDMLSQYVKPLNETARSMLKKWESHSEYFNCSPDLRVLVLDSLVRSIFSLKSSIQERRGFSVDDYISAQNVMKEAIDFRTTKPFFFFDFTYNLTSHSKQFYRAQDYVYKVNLDFVKERNKEIKRLGTTEMKDFCTILLTTPKSDGSYMSDEEIENEINFFIFAGHDTTASTIEWAIYCLGKYPELQEKCREEIQSVLGENENVTVENIQDLAYLTMFLKESIRMYPAVINSTKVNKKPLEIDGYKIPKGTMILISAFQAHYSEEFWPQPEKFDPDRFSPENIDKIHPFSFLPFSSGPRNCVGQSLAKMEMVIVLALLIQKYRISIDEAHSYEPNIKGVACSPRYGTKVKLEKV